MAAYISGISVVIPDRRLRRLAKRGIVKRLISSIIKRDGRLDFNSRTGKMLSHLYSSMPSKLPINSVYWPTGARRFAVGVFLVTEQQSSLIFSMSAALSNPDYLMIDYVSSGDTIGGASQVMSPHCLLEELSQVVSRPSQFQVNDQTSGQSISGFHNVSSNMAIVINEQMADYSAKFNLMPLPVTLTQRSIYNRPYDKQSYFAAWMVPIVYIPIMESDNIIDRVAYNSHNIDGVGILIMVDQRFFWHFTPVPTALIFGANTNECYFSWVKMVSMVAKLFLFRWQYDERLLGKYGRKFWWHYVNVSENDWDPCLLSEGKRERKFDDDRGFFGVPIDFYTQGADYTLADFFSLVEQSLGKKLIFHPNWQIEFVNPIIARRRMVRNLLLFTPRVTFLNEELWTEVDGNIPKPRPEAMFIKELPIIMGGLPVSISKNKLKLAENGSAYADNIRITESPEPRHHIFLPHVIEIVGNMWLTPDPYEDNPSLDESAGSFFPLSYVYYRACLVPSGLTRVFDNNAYEFPEEEQWFYEDEYGQRYYWYYSAFLPGSFMASDPLVPMDVSVYRIYTSHLCIVAEEPMPDVSIVNPKEDSKVFANRAVSVRLGRLIVRDWLSWYGLPFLWEFAACCYWPFTGYEDYEIIRANGRVSVVGHHPHIISNRQGIRYVGWESPNAEIVEELDSHELLSDEFHSDASGDGPTEGGVPAASPD